MDIHEIRSSFALSEEVSVQIGKLIKERISDVINGITPIKLQSKPKAIIHVIPLSSLGGRLYLDPEKMENENINLAPIYGWATDQRYNIDGFLSYTRGSGNGKVDASYCQLFRSGMIESVTEGFTKTHDAFGTYISCLDFENRIIATCGNYIKALRSLDVPPPVVIAMSLLDASGISLRDHLSGVYFDGRKIDRSTVHLPDIWLEDYDMDLERELRPLFDGLYNAAGAMKCPHYDSEGNRKKHT